MQANLSGGWPLCTYAQLTRKCNVCTAWSIVKVYYQYYIWHYKAEMKSTSVSIEYLLMVSFGRLTESSLLAEITCRDLGREGQCQSIWYKYHWMCWYGLVLMATPWGQDTKGMWDCQRLDLRSCAAPFSAGEALSLPAGSVRLQIWQT